MKDDQVFLRHILEEADFIIKESRDLEYENLLNNEVLKRALVRSLEIIGEASKNISIDFKKRHREIEWRELTGLRDKLIHHYFGINWNRVLDVVKNFIPKLKEQLQKLPKEN